MVTWNTLKKGDFPFYAQIPHAHLAVLPQMGYCHKLEILRFHLRLLVSGVEGTSSTDGISS